MKTVDEILKNLGLTDNEAKVFLSALKVGLAPISRIAQESGIARTYVYELAEELKQKGLLAEIEQRGVKKVEALDYGGLLAYVGRRQKDMERLEKDLVKSAGAFHALRSVAPQKTKVRFFEGIEGIKNINSEIKKDLDKLRQPYQFYTAFSVDRMEDILPGWTEHNQHLYDESFMSKYAIISETPMLQNFLNKVRENHQKNFYYKIWPIENREFPTDTLCWLNKIAYLDMKGHPSGIIIENNAIVETFVMWFKQMWGSLK
ncbi:MAG: helix-turn-helix domain-containing protein [Candidatus Doudnabacteria bacterium]|nr:helix-turn-helix domain-containing protein [Candidatus Doudnabacteria bacterium]